MGDCFPLQRDWVLAFTAGARSGVCRDQGALLRHLLPWDTCGHTSEVRVHSSHGERLHSRDMLLCLSTESLFSLCKIKISLNGKLIGTGKQIRAEEHSWAWSRHGGCQADSSMYASGNWIQHKDEQMLPSFSAFDFCVSGSALCTRAAFLAISSWRLMLLLNKEKQSAGSQGNTLLGAHQGLIFSLSGVHIADCTMLVPRRLLLTPASSLHSLPYPREGWGPQIQAVS